MDYVIWSTEDSACYRFMENGRPIVGLSDVPHFDEVTVNKICKHLATFRGDTVWEKLKIVYPAELVNACKTNKETAEKRGVHKSTIQRWLRNDSITYPYMKRAAMLIGQANESSAS